VTEPETPTAPDAAHDAKPAAEAPAPPRQTSMVPGPPPGIPVRPRGSAPVVVKLERFEGPLDLLLHLIKRDEIDIYDIPISRITQQYLAYLELMRGRLAELVPSLIEVESILIPMRGVRTCHLDLWSDNLRRTAGGDLCVIDFDNCGPADPGRELGMLLFEFGRGQGARWRALDEAYREAGGPGRITGRESLALTVAQLHHIGHRHLTMWLSARDAVARARSSAGVEEFLGEPFLLSDVDRLLDATTSTP